MQIAVIGLGRMGESVAARLIETGNEVAVWNRSAGKADRLVSAGAKECSDVQEAVNLAEIVITSLSADDAVRAVALGRTGISTYLGGRLFIEASTISPGLSAELAEQVPHHLAMPIAGSPTAVRAGEATYLVGGVDGDIDRAQPLLDSLSTNQLRYPSAPLASVAKLTVNALLLTGLVGVAESVAIGRAGGLSDDALATLLTASPMIGPGVKNRLDAVIAGDGPPWWTMELAVKDATLALDTASMAGEKLPAAIAVRERYQAAVDLGLSDHDIAAVARLYLPATG
jgi:3-hydroxyisobutyrate dehydrogenase